MLILFDIDGTMLRSEGAGVKAMLQAGRELFGERWSFEGIEIAGRLDTLIFRDLCAKAEIARSDDAHDRFRSRYGTLLAQRLSEEPTARALPGVRELVAALADRTGVTLGVLTGNYPETGRLKITAAGLDPDAFLIGAWGNDGATRRDLPPVAMRRHRELLGRDIEAGRVVIIGDTPADIDCAKHNGCRVIAVATGAFDVERLSQDGADLVVDTLAETERLVSWMVE